LTQTRLRGNILSVALTQYLKIEREAGAGSRIHIIRLEKPGLLVEFKPLYDAKGRIRDGEIKRVCVQNSPQGNYGQYAKLVREAEKFFHSSLEEHQTFLNRLG